MILKRIFPLLAATVLSLQTLHAAEVFPKVEIQPAFPELRFARPLWLSESPDGTKRFFVAQQGGKVLILPKDRKGSEMKTFLDISDRKPQTSNEEGLLGFAFHPKFKKNGKFYIYYSQLNPRRSIISEFQVSKTNPDEADKSSERILLEIPQPAWNHNGGQVAFGPDGYLYIALGDGGGANDQFRNGQNLNSLLSKFLRIDVDSKTGDLAYGIPKDNPFVGQANVRAEIWAWGMRNPWRFSFDRKTGELYCGDVGQNLWEEIDIIKKGENYGWNVREGFHAFGTNPPPANVKFTDPIIEYPHLAQQTNTHSPGLSVTGGYVYRGKKVPSLQGVYLYADFLKGTIWGLRYSKGKVSAQANLIDMPVTLVPPRQVASFGEDLSGEVYILSYDGRIYELSEAKTK